MILPIPLLLSENFIVVCFFISLLCSFYFVRVSLPVFPVFFASVFFINSHKIVLAVSLLIRGGMCRESKKEDVVI